MDDLISIVTLGHNKAEYTRRYFEGLAQTTYRPLEIVFVNNGSTDHTPAVLEQAQADLADTDLSLRVITNSQNEGCCTARNRGLEVVRGEFVVLMDNDIVARTRSCFERMTAALKSDPTIGIVGPKLVYPFPPYDIQFAGGAVSPKGRVDFMGRGQKRDAPEHNQPRTVQCIISACMMMPRRIVEAVGPLDEQFNPIQFEDIDYSYRVRHAGYTIVYLPSVEMYHFENVTSGQTRKINYTYLTIKNGMKFKRKWHSMFSQEGGPLDSEMQWADVPKRPLEEVGELPFLP